MWFDELSGRACQAVALDGLRRWSYVTGVDCASLRQFEDHLWTWIDFGDADFMTWYQAQPGALGAALDDRVGLPVDLVDACVRAQIEPDQVRRLLNQVAFVTYGYLFGAVEPDPIIENLLQIGEILAAHNEYLRPAEDFVEETDGAGTVGRPRSELVAYWRERAGEPR